MFGFLRRKHRPELQRPSFVEEAQQILESSSAQGKPVLLELSDLGQKK